MTIISSCHEIELTLDRIKTYDKIIRGDSLTTATVTEMKGNCKAMADSAKDEVDEIKSIIDTWT